MLAPDLLGHGSSPVQAALVDRAHLDAVVETVGREPADWIGHSFGGRLAFELAARRPELVDGSSCSTLRSTFPAHVALFAAENARAGSHLRLVRRGDRASLRREPAAPRATGARGGGAPRSPSARRRRPLALPLLPGSRRGCLRRDGLRRRRRSRTRARRRCSCSGRRATSPYDHLLAAHRAALGDLLTVVTVSGGHTVLWDALDETADGDHGLPRRVNRSTPSGESGGRPTGEEARRAGAGSGGSGPSCQTQCSSAMASASSRIATPSSTSSRVIVSGGTTMTTFQWVIR